MDRRRPFQDFLRPPEKESSSVWMYVAIGLTITLIAGLIVMLYWNVDQKQETRTHRVDTVLPAGTVDRLSDPIPSMEREDPNFTTLDELARQKQDGSLA